MMVPPSFILLPLSLLVLLIALLGGRGVVVAVEEQDPWMLVAPAVPFADNHLVVWGANDHVHLHDDGYALTMKLDQQSGSAFQSIHKYRYGFFSIQIKLPKGHTAGVVATVYLSAMTEKKNELDFEFLGNVSGEPWTLQTNIFSKGTGGREERISLWFDPTTEFHTYSILWNYHQIVFYVDSYPIRVHRNTRITNVLYLSKEPMWLFGSIWNGDTWATMKGLEKIKWQHAPFIASFRKFSVNGCAWEDPYPSCVSNTSCFWWDQYPSWTLDQKDQDKYHWVRNNYLVYDFCTDFKRYPVPMPDCSSPMW